MVVFLLPSLGLTQPEECPLSIFKSFNLALQDFVLLTQEFRFISKYGMLVSDHFCQNCHIPDLGQYGGIWLSDRIALALEACRYRFESTPMFLLEPD